MASSPSVSLETLPLLVVERICEYLNFDSDDRHGLWAFSLTSRYCCAASAPMRFCQVRLEIPASNEVESSLERWTKLLNPDARYRYVRRLKIMRGLSSEQRHPEVKGDEDAQENWRIRDYFDMHKFCRSTKSSVEQSGVGVVDPPGASLARFINQLPALEDLIWGCGSDLPPSILSAVHERGCRLHMHYFRLGSLVQSRGSPHALNPGDYVLASSPCLTSIVVRIIPFGTDGTLDYNEEAVKHMVAGMAPNLAHLWLIRMMAGDSLPSREAYRLGKPARADLFPDMAELESVRLGGLRSLVFTGYESNDIKQWGLCTEFTKLRRLTIPWTTENGIALADMASSGNFQSLDTLVLSSIQDKTDGGIETLTRFLENVTPLQRLDLDGHISNRTFQICLRRHGRTLCHLSLWPYRDEKSQSPVLIVSEPVVQQLAEECLDLEQVWLSINRTRGDRQETGIYRALSRLPRLKRVSLRLQFSVGPDQETWDEERDGEHPLSCCFENENIPPGYLRDAFTNGGIDATLALSIFNLISSSVHLEYLRLEMRRKRGRHGPIGSDALFEGILRWFNRCWACKQDPLGKVTIRELHVEETIEAGRDWQYLSEEQQYNGGDIYEKVFKDVWPQKTEQWWSDWEALPLSN